LSERTTITTRSLKYLRYPTHTSA